jgi:hypothetical protein
MLVNVAIQGGPESERVEGILGEAEVVRVDLVGLGDLTEVDLRLPVDQGFAVRESKTGRAPREARPANDQRDEKAAPDQTLSFSLRWQVLIPLSPAVMALANSAWTLAPSPLNEFLKPAVWIVFATAFLFTE